MNDADEWARLQDAWGADAPAAPPMPDVTAMIARARRERRLIMWTIVGEWALAAVAAGMLVARWPLPATEGILLLWTLFYVLVMCVVMVSYTWTRLQALQEPSGASLRDWLDLRRRRALLGLRLARLTRWTTIALLPAPVVSLITARDAWNAAWSSVAVTLVLAGGWIWARRKTRRMTAEIADVDALAREWLDEPPTI
ncbi:hypothetical protein ABIB42_002862 [Massilia sp. UYP32]|jgi:hypothetical protein|uniref:Uncharacterized protein n=1 Tax=Massilia timonae CCUG 45783 TaxID=883126 RepID=K9DCN5_9BURK|nr:hypothetical protein [Massilia timonae]EKU81036.1 hypothetical protein HMPREF9710_03666 [Massilia timonae CCUG 45783]